MLHPCGRPTGTTDAENLSLKNRLMQVHNVCTIEYAEAKNAAKNSERKKVKRGCLESIIKKQKKAFGLSEKDKIDKEAIRARYYRKNLTMTSMGPKFPMEKVEPQLVELIIRMSRIRRCLTGAQCLHLANDLIAGTKIEKDVIKFKEQLCKQKCETASLGLNYWRGFKKDGHIDLLVRGDRSLH